MDTSEHASAAAYRRRVEHAGLGGHADALAALLRPSIRLTPGWPRVGRTHLGGHPQLGPAVGWPVDGDLRPLCFVAQVDLAEIAHLDAEQVLPSSGLLSFFYDADPVHGVWGFRPSDRFSWRVIHTPPDVAAPTRRFPDDLPAAARFTEVPLIPSSELTLPGCESYEVTQLGLTQDEHLALADTYPATEDPVIHRLLGNPDPVQGDMQVECQLVSHGIDMGAPGDWDHPRRSELERDSAEWRLLLQVDSDTTAGMRWGDAGRLYWWIRESDLRRRKFERCWLVLQCF